MTRKIIVNFDNGTEKVIEMVQEIKETENDWRIKYISSTISGSMMDSVSIDGKHQIVINKAKVNFFEIVDETVCG
jgi:hypothetical protein